MKQQNIAAEPSVQERFMSELINSHTTVDLFLVNGIRLQGEIVAFDQYVIQLKGAAVSQVYKSAVSTIQLFSNARSPVAARRADNSATTIMKRAQNSHRR